jgi:YbgC/YbaW family acyl-CoA thioester hydrolase
VTAASPPGDLPAGPAGDLPAGPAGDLPAGHARVTVQRRVEWPDTDAAGHYHHSTVVRWVEAAEAVLYDRLGLTDLFGRIPRVRYEVDYRARLWFGDLVEVTVAVAALGRTSITYAFEVRRDGSVAGAGRMVAVQSDPAGGDPLPWPDDVRRLFLESGEQAPERFT